MLDNTLIPLAIAILFQHLMESSLVNMVGTRQNTFFSLEKTLFSKENQIVAKEKTLVAKENYLAG